MFSTENLKKRRSKRERREKGDLRVFSGVRPARERPCRRRKPYSFSKRFLFASSSSRLTDRFVGALDWNHPSTVVSLRGGKTRSRGGSRREKRGLHVSVVWEMEAITDPSTSVCSPGGGGFLSFAAAGSSSRKGEAFFAPFLPVLAPEGRGSHSSTLSV
ncbi:hypothetical protein YC2023_110311 [Brassica napus]